MLARIMENLDFVILNGRSGSDFPANFTHISYNGKSIVDLCWCSANGINSLTNFEVMQFETLSDHFPIVVTFENCFVPLSETQTVKLIWQENRAFEFSEKMSYRPEVCKIFGTVDEMNDILIKTMYNVASNLGLLKKTECTFFREQQTLV